MRNARHQMCVRFDEVLPATVPYRATIREFLRKNNLWGLGSGLYLRISSSPHLTQRKSTRQWVLASGDNVGHGPGGNAVFIDRQSRLAVDDSLKSFGCDPPAPDGGLANPFSPLPLTHDLYRITVDIKEGEKLLRDLGRHSEGVSFVLPNHLKQSESRESVEKVRRGGHDVSPVQVLEEKKRRIDLDGELVDERTNPSPRRPQKAQDDRDDSHDLQDLHEEREAIPALNVGFTHG